MIEVCCADCAHFLRDKLGNGSGIGNCLLLEQYKLKRPSDSALDAALKKMGGKALYPHALRFCDKFKSK